MFQTHQINELCIAGIWNKVHLWRWRFWWWNLQKHRKNLLVVPNTKINKYKPARVFFLVVFEALVWQPPAFEREFDYRREIDPKNENTQI